MKMRPRVLLLAIVPLATALDATVIGAQVDQHAIAQRLLQGDIAERDGAFAQAWTLGPRKIGPELRAALITLLDRNSRIVVEAAKRKEAVAKFAGPEFIAHVAHLVSQLEDSQAIPALAEALGNTGSTLVPDALADFGEAAAPAVLKVVTSPKSRYDAVDDGLLALRFMVEETGTRPLSPGTLGQVRDAARQRLTGKQYFTTLWYAIDLAVVMRDPGLKQIVESLASDPNEVRARGVTDPDLVASTQKRAAGRLAPNAPPPLPRYRSPGERSRSLDPRWLQ